jgi:hypothetical protein
MRVLAVGLLCSLCSLAGLAAEVDVDFAQRHQSPVLRMSPRESCRSSSELLKHGSMNIGIRFTTSNSKLVVEFENAMNFWTTVIDMHWHAEQSSLCSLELIDGQSDLFDDSTVAKAHLAQTDESSNWIAFNAKVPFTRGELYLTAIHEVGHLLGLEHNPNVSSVMYYTNAAGAILLDATDLSALAERHKLRRGSASAPIRCTSGHLGRIQSAESFWWPRPKMFLIFHQPRKLVHQ